MPSADPVLEEIRNRLDIVDVVSDYVHLKKAGQNWKGLCPFHTEKTPSFTVSPTKQIFHCFGCNSGGDIFSFLMRYENLTFPESLNILAKRAGVTLRAERGSGIKTGEKEGLLNINRDSLAFFIRSIARDTKAQEYVKNRRIDKETQKRYAIGFAPDSWNALLTYLTGKGYKPELIRKAGLINQGARGYYDIFRNRIIFPIHDLKGDVIAFGGRSIDGADPKYLNSPETDIFNKRKVLFGLSLAKEHIKQSGYALLMEGYTDVISAHIHGFPQAVAPLGTALTTEHGKLIKRFAEDIILVFDSDEAGMKAAKNASRVLLESGLTVRVVLFPERDDPDSYLKKKGAAAFQELLDNALSVIDFYLSQKGNYRLLAREAIETISKVPDKVLQGYYVKMLSERLKINEIFIIEELKKKKYQSGSHNQNPALSERKVKTGNVPLDEVYTIQLLLQLTDRAGIIIKDLSTDDFRHAFTRGIYERIKSGMKDLNELLLHVSGEEKAFLSEIALREDFEEPEKALKDCVKKLRNNSRKALLHDLQKKIKQAEQKRDLPMLKKLQLEQHELMKLRGNDKTGTR